MTDGAAIYMFKYMLAFEAAIYMFKYLLAFEKSCERKGPTSKGQTIMMEKTKS